MPWVIRTKKSEINPNCTSAVGSSVVTSEPLLEDVVPEEEQISEPTVHPSKSQIQEKSCFLKLLHACIVMKKSMNNLLKNIWSSMSNSHQLILLLDYPD